MLWLDWKNRNQNGAQKAKQEIHIKWCLYHFKKPDWITLAYVLNKYHTCRDKHKFKCNIHQDQIHSWHFNDLPFVFGYHILNNVLFHQWLILIGFKIHHQIFHFYYITVYNVFKKNAASKHHIIYFFKSSYNTLM